MVRLSNYCMQHCEGILIIILVVVYCSFCQLVVNVQNRGQVIVENFQANTSTDSVTLQYLSSDDNHILLFIDFKNEIQIIHAVVPGEEELGSSHSQILCLIAHFNHGDFISLDAMSKLRQRNPTAIRTPEEERSPIVYTCDLSIDVKKSHAISPHIIDICQDAPNSTYIADLDLQTISKSLSKDYAAMRSAATRSDRSGGHARCMDIQHSGQPCLCRFDTCVGWFPCSLKYCQGKNTLGKTVSYRCGIKACKRCYTFYHVVDSTDFCLSDW